MDRAEILQAAHACICGEREQDYGTLRSDPVCRFDTKIADSGERTEFASGAVRDLHKGKGRFDLLPWFAIWEVARHCENGAEKYGERNVDKGIPLHSLLDSAARHLAETMIGKTDEDHLRAACWNLLWALQQRTTHPELDDMPKEAGNNKET